MSIWKTTTTTTNLPSRVSAALTKLVPLIFADTVLVTHSFIIIILAFCKNSFGGQISLKFPLSLSYSLEDFLLRLFIGRFCNIKFMLHYKMTCKSYWLTTIGRFNTSNYHNIQGLIEISKCPPKSIPFEMQEPASS